MDYPPKLMPHNLHNAKLFASKYSLISSFQERLKDGTIAEIGVAYGDFSEYMINTLQPKRFDAYDLFSWTSDEVVWGKECKEKFDGKTHLEFFNQRFKSLIDDKKMFVFQGDSSSNLQNSDISYDMIYIDGDHSVDGVRRDAFSALSKLNGNGILIFNDYILYDHFTGTEYGVIHVVNDLCVNHGLRVTGFALANHMFCDISLERQYYI